jgi:hypothetical protein
VILGIDELNRVPKLAIVESDGTLHKILDLDNKTYEKDTAVNRVFNTSKDPVDKDHIYAVERALSFAEFLPDGPNVVLLQGTTSLPAKVIGDEGEISEFTLTSPPGSAILEVLASDPKGPIVARLQGEAQLSKSIHEGPVSNPNEPLVEFSRETGKMLKWIKVAGGPLPQEVTCATNGELTAIYWPAEKPAAPNQPPPVDQLFFAKAPF